MLAVSGETPMVSSIATAPAAMSTATMSTASVVRDAVRTPPRGGIRSTRASGTVTSIVPPAAARSQSGRVAHQVGESGVGRMVPVPIATTAVTPASTSSTGMCQR